MSKQATCAQIMARHYLICAAWADCEEGTYPEPSESAKTKALADCEKFIYLSGSLVALAESAEGYGSHPDCGTVHPAYAAMGHDLWLTRNGHGVGFWDRDALTAVELDGGTNLGLELSKIADDMGQSYFSQAGDSFYID